MSKFYEKSFEIRVHHCDMYGNLMVSELLKFMQDCAMIHAELLGVGMDAMHERNMTFVLSRMQLNILRMPSFGGNITIRTYPVDIERLFYIREFYITTEGAECAEARSMWLVIDLDSRRPVRDAEFSHELPRWQCPEVIMKSPQKPRCNPEAPLLLEKRVMYTDVDILGHANNTRYAAWACDCAGNGFFKNNPSFSFTINFSSELREGEYVKIFGEGNIYCGINESGQEAFSAKLERICNV
ncbi:MAG: thioesterase [Clostridia bacterium]|nr:thioesterase [Clostridia bacterium]